MKILLSVNWNISECQLIAHGLFNEIWITGIVQWPFSESSAPLNDAKWRAHFREHSLIFFNVQRKQFFIKKNQIRGFKVIVLWITTYEINKKWGERSCPLAGSNPCILFLVVSKPVRCLYASLLQIGYGLIWILICIHFQQFELKGVVFSS